MRLGGKSAGTLFQAFGFQTLADRGTDWGIFFPIGDAMTDHAN